MAGLGVRLFTDEMVDTALAVELRRRGYDAISCREAGRANQGLSDESQLQFATVEGRAVLTYNFGDFQRLDAVWRAAGRAHAGVIFAPAGMDVGALLRVTVRHLDSVGPETQHNLVLWLPGQ